MKAILLQNQSWLQPYALYKGSGMIYIIENDHNA